MKPSARPILTALRRGYAAQAAAQSGESVSLSKQAPRISKLANGVTVATVENNSPVSRVAMLYNAGSRFEDSSTEGVTHFLRSASSLSTKQSSGFLVTRNIQQIGGNLTCTASREHLIFSLECLRTSVEVGTEVLSYATGPSFKPWEVKDFTPHLVTELAMLNEQPNVVLMEALHKAAYRTTLGNSLYMPAHKVGKHSSELLQQYADKHLSLANSVIVASGVEHDHFIHILSHKLGLSKAAAGQAVTPNKATFYGGGDVRIENNSPIVHAAVVTEGVSLSNNDMLPLAILQKVMGTGPTVKYSGNGNSKTTQAAAKVTSNPFAVSAINVNYSDSGLFGFYTVTHAEDAGNVLKALVGEFSQATKGVSDADVQRAKNQLKSDVLMSLESEGGSLEDMGAQVALTGQILDTNSITQAIDSVTAAQVSAIAKKVINGKPSMAAVGDLSHTPYLDQLV